MSIDTRIVSQEPKKGKRGRPKSSPVDDEVRISKRCRNWLFIVYPESAPSDWRERLRSLHLQGCISPLHDADINEPDQEQKKPHYHVMLCYDGPTSWDIVKEIARDQLHGTYPIPCNSMRGSVRYFCHLDNPEKAQYSLDQMIPLGGFDVEAALDISGAMLRQAVREMQEYIIKYDVREFCEFADFCLLNNTEWHTILTEKRTIFFEKYIRSRRHLYLDQKQVEEIAAKLFAERQRLDDK